MSPMWASTVAATGDKELRQNFALVPSSSVTSITFWIKRPASTGDTPVEVWLFYDGSPSSGHVYQINGTSWQLVDVTSQIAPGKSPKGIAISGYSLGSTYIDDVSILATEAPVLFSPSAASTHLYFAQLADGGDAVQKWTTTVMLVNPSVTTATSVSFLFTTHGVGSRRGQLPHHGDRALPSVSERHPQVWCSSRRDGSHVLLQLIRD